MIPRSPRGLFWLHRRASGIRTNCTSLQSLRMGSATLQSDPVQITDTPAYREVNMPVNE